MYYFLHCKYCYFVVIEVQFLTSLPGSPEGPLSPGGPTGPGGPRSPAEPGAPCLPGSPYTHRKYFYL